VFYMLVDQQVLDVWALVDRLNLLSQIRGE
jgi:hypothetical protein